MSQQRTVVQAITAASVVRPNRKPNTVSKTRGVERNDSLTAVTSRTARATHQTGQWPPTGHGSVDRVDTVAGSGSGFSLAGVVASRTGNGYGGSTTGVSSVACAGAGVGAATVERSGGEMTELAHITCACSAVWASGWFSAPFFPLSPG